MWIVPEGLYVGVQKFYKDRVSQVVSQTEDSQRVDNLARAENRPCTKLPSKKPGSEYISPNMVSITAVRLCLTVTVPHVQYSNFGTSVNKKNSIYFYKQMLLSLAPLRLYNFFFHHQYTANVDENV